MEKNAPKGMFTVRDDIPDEEAERLGCVKVGLCFVTRPIRAIATGEFRIPKKGDWYLLFGSILEEYFAYFAPEDCVVTPYYIAKLVRTQEIKTRIIVQE